MFEVKFPKEYFLVCIYRFTAGSLNMNEDEGTILEVRVNSITQGNLILLLLIIVILIFYSIKLT